MDLFGDFSLLQYCVYTTFAMTFVAMAAASLFFFMSTSRVPEGYREAMITTGLILFIAAVNYFFMTQLYERAATGEGGSAFPTAFRYIDWILTTPLMLLKFPLLLGLGKGGRKLMRQLIALDLVMIVCGFFGELLFDQPVWHYSLFGVASVCWLAIAAMLLRAVAFLPARVDDAKRTCIRRMSRFVVFGWVVYPLGYLIPSIPGIAGDYRELVYNIADAINKIGLGLVIYVAAVEARKALTGETEGKAVPGAASAAEVAPVR